jgi:hypothetical protein
MKAPGILKSLDEAEDYYKDKVRLLAKLIDYPRGGYIIKQEISQWAIANGLDATCSCEDRTSWWTCSEFFIKTK